MADGQRKRSGAPIGPNVPTSRIEPPQSRRPLLSPANDNTMGPARRILRAAVFVAIGAVLAWLLRIALG